MCRPVHHCDSPDRAFSVNVTGTTSGYSRGLFIIIIASNEEMLLISYVIQFKIKKPKTLHGFQTTPRLFHHSCLQKLKANGETKLSLKH